MLDLCTSTISTGTGSGSGNIAPPTARQVRLLSRSVTTTRYHTNFGPAVRDFLAKYREQTRSKEIHNRNMEMKMAARVVRRFPSVDLDALKEKYPLVDMNMLMRWKKARRNEYSQD